MRIGLWLLGLVALVSATPVAAQRRDTTARDGVSAEHRGQMERRLRARLGEVVRTQLELSEEQARQLAEVDRRYQPERRRLMGREMEVRQSLRRQVAAGEAADQQAVAGLLDQMLTLQRQRIDLMAREQGELAAFLTPVQRAKLISLQADLHRRVSTMRRTGPGGRGAGREQRNER